MKQFLIVILLISAILSINSKTLNPKKVVYAVDCGNPQGSKSTLGFFYQPDQGYTQNTKVADYGINPEVQGATIKYTPDQPVYFTERHADETFGYEVPLTSPGKYVLILKFSELYFKASRKRVFAIRFGETRVRNEIDVFHEVGKNAAFDAYIEFEFRNDQVFANGERCQNAVRGGKLVVVFEKIGIDNPKVDGIVLFSGELADTDYSEISQMRSDWDKRITEEGKRKEEERQKREEAKLKRREKVKVRNDEFEEFEEEEEGVDGGHFQEDTKTQLFRLISNPMVLLLFGGIIAVSFFGIGGGPKNLAPEELVESSPDDKKKDAASKKKKKN